MLFRSPFNFTDEDYRYIFDQDPPVNITRHREQDDSVMSDVQPSNLGRQLDAVQSETMENEMDDRQFLETMFGKMKFNKDDDRKRAAITDSSFPRRTTMDVLPTQHERENEDTADDPLVQTLTDTIRHRGAMDLLISDQGEAEISKQSVTERYIRYCSP